MKTAYDLDGVLIPDCDQIPQLGGLAEFYALTMYMRPLFVPAAPYDIITARPMEFRDITVAWCNKYLDPQPNTLYHGRMTAFDTAEKYKLLTLMHRPDIELYVESDLAIVEYLSKYLTTKCKVLHFADYVKQQIGNYGN